ncbi:unnamed protein product [Tilletia controversa]|uniref:DASH complex subunit DAD3 n=3 Tax=Tilletia TaxID=13289 RepID=A0A8X7SWM0_9BASI|nr:hypothetical protein CF336_g5534 [Tilletia laevis]KAE8193358.1 hypothetical protein CF328_g5070 [Tilletia controversa]KAE8257086.1 hypothetical protein A4X03_0g4786 [Tilletia caries]KAE8202313.1 hypothetical protein CF335_g3468 [Tilletia laevis]KAE8247629.1 hypothetical protein A4X06_0g4309 [Tilletia controversa]
MSSDGAALLSASSSGRYSHHDAAAGAGAGREDDEIANFDTADEGALSNPYANHPQLSQTEAALLFEYHKLATTMKRIQEISYSLASPTTHTALLHSIRVLERKMGLVLTLFKASVWALLVERQDAAEAEAAAAAASSYIPAQHAGLV